MAEMSAHPNGDNGRSGVIPTGVACLLAITLAVLQSSCAGGGVASTAGQQPGSAGRTALKLLPDSMYDSGDLRLEFGGQSGRLEVSVIGEAIENASALYLELSFDHERWEYEGTTSGPFFGVGEAIELTAQQAHGVLQHGQVLKGWNVREGVSGDGEIARFTFVKKNSAAARGASIPEKLATGVPTSNGAAHYLNFNPGSSVFLWYYVNPGDYDQNGEVGITDLTPLGLYFNDEGPFGVTDSRSVVDGDGNGVINIADITAIGQNFGNSITSFAVYGSSTGGDYPDSNAGANGPGARQIGTRAFSLGKGGGNLRRYWDMVAAEPVIGNGRYWLRPVAGGNEGTPSQLVSHNQQWHTQVLFDYDGEPTDNSGLNGMDIGYFGGRPVIVLNVHKNGGIARYYWFEAEDAAGTTWASPRTLFDLSDINYGANLASIDGVPALSWFNFSGKLMFNRATDETAESWTVPVEVDDFIDAGISNRLLFFDGRPVVIFANGAQQVNIRVAKDEWGADWNARQVIYNPARIGNFGAVPLLGGIGVTVEDDDTAAIVYSFVEISGNAVGVGDPTYIFEDNTGSNGRNFLGVAAGAPYSIVHRLTPQSFYYSKALDATGNSWVVPSPISLEGVIGISGNTEAYGVPWIVYNDPTGGFVRAAHADGPQDISWTATGHIEDEFPLVNGLVMSTVGPHPAVVFYDSSTGIVKFSIFY